MQGYLIAGSVVIALFLLFVLYDKRKKIFKKREKKTKKEIKTKEKTLKEEVKPAEALKSDKEDSKVSFEKRIDQKMDVAPVVQELNLDENENIEYSQGFAPSTRSRRSFPQRQNAPQTFFKPQKRSIKDQINDLSPEMKAILFASVLEKKDDQF